MIDTVLSSLVKDKRVLIIGFGREGRSTYSRLEKIGGYASLDVCDAKAQDGVKYSGDGYLDIIDEYDVAFKSPGVVLPKPAPEYKCKITAQVDVFLSVYGDRTVGITGTKGKSTVSTLLYHVLKSAGIPAVLGGNIGIPVFDIADTVEDDTTVVLELSCHQLEWCPVSPRRAILLNFYEDHLDHYGTFEKYVAAKKNIYLAQDMRGTLYCGENALPRPGEAKGSVMIPERDMLPFESFEEIGARLRGEHNLGNCAFVYAVAAGLGVTDEAFTAAVASYEPLRHRLELCGSADGVEYFDDSISTTVESAISAMESIKNASVILLGGMDRGIDYDKLVSYIAEGRGPHHVVCMYKSGERIYSMLKEKGCASHELYLVPDLAEAVKTAKAAAPKGSAVILSPASASYGYFKNFEERGDAFRALALGK